MTDRSSGSQPSLFHAMLGHLGLLFRLERKIVGLIVSYSVAIGLFALIIPLTVQELVNTFAYAIQPITIITLAGIMIVALTLVGAFKALQYYAVEMLERRIFTRTAIAMTKQLTTFDFAPFQSRYANYFMETIWLQRALSVLLVDLVNVLIGGAVGMTILVFYHPYFLVYNTLLVVGFSIVFFVLPYGGLRTTIEMSHVKYEMLHWIQEISKNLLHAKVTDSQALLMQRTDQVAEEYITARQARFAILMRQYLGSVGGQAIAHTGVLATAGWLLSIGELTLGQLVAAEVVVTGLLIDFDSVIKHMGHVYYFLTALVKLDTFFSLPRDHSPVATSVSLPDPTIHGLRVTCKTLSVVHGGVQVFESFDLEATPGERIGIYAPTIVAKTSLARILAGLDVPTSGIVRYNDIDLRHLDLDVINRHRGFMLDSYLSLFEGTIEDNIVLGRTYVPYQDLHWALRFTELGEEIDMLPLGIKTEVQSLGNVLAPSLLLRILLARTIVARPQLLIFEGILHDMEPTIRETIMRRICDKEEPWSVIFVSNDPNLTPHIDRRLILH